MYETSLFLSLFLKYICSRYKNLCQQILSLSTLNCCPTFFSLALFQQEIILLFVPLYLSCISSNTYNIYQLYIIFSIYLIFSTLNIFIHTLYNMYICIKYILYRNITINYIYILYKQYIHFTHTLSPILQFQGHWLALC